MDADSWTSIGVVADVYDGPHATPRKIEKGPYFLSISSLESGMLDLAKSAHLSETDFKKWTKRVTPQEGDVLFSYETRLGAAALMPPNVKACLGRRMGLLRPKTNIVIPEYLLYAYLSPVFQDVIKSKTIHGATVDRIALKELPSFPVRIPSKDEQLKVVSILKSVSSKIELNRQTNQTLEQIAQAIFKSWFVDFDPVKAKIEAKAADRDPERAAMCAISGKSEAEFDQLSAEQRKQLAATAALFPDELVESELGLIPVGWGEQRLENLLDLSYGKALKKTDRENGIIPVYGSGGVTGYHNKHLVDGPGIVVGRKGTVGSLYWEDDNFFPIDTVFYVVPKSNISLVFLFHLLETLGLKDMNTDAAVPGMSRNNAYRLLVPSFPKELIRAFAGRVSGLRKMQSHNVNECKGLGEIRDALLPKLLSGEISLTSEAQQAEATA